MHEIVSIMQEVGPLIEKWGPYPLCVLLVVYLNRNPWILDLLRIKKASQNGHVDLTKRAEPELVARDDCHKSMDSLNVSLSEIRKEVSQGFARVHERIDTIWEKMGK